MASAGLICAHKLLGYLLLPIRILIVIPFFIIALILIYISYFGILPKDLAYFVLKSVFILSSVIFGLNIHINQDKAYENYKMMSLNEKYVVVYNHINPLDIFVLSTALDNYISFIADGKTSNIFPVNYMCKFVDAIMVNKGKRTNTTEKIDKHLKTSKHKLCIAPDECKYFEENEYIHSFKTGAFANKNNVLPVIIRYVPSYKSDDFIWNKPGNEDMSLIKHMKNLLLDGNIDVYIKFLDLQKYDETKYKTCNDYANSVREKMKNELKKLPKQNESQLNKVTETNINCIFFITFICLCISIIAIFFSDFEFAFHTMSLSFTGFLYHSFPTNSTLLFDRIFVYYSVYKMLVAKNSQSISLIKYCLIFYATITCIKNNCDEQKPGAEGGRGPDHWLKKHLYDVQFPVCLVALLALIDRNLFIK